MIYNNRDIKITINGTGLLCNSATLSINPNIDPILAIGMSSFADYQINDGPTSEITLNYTPEVFAEPNHSISTNIRISHDYSRNFQLVYAGITGDYYLRSYSFSVNELNEAQASASYVCFHQLSGNYASLNNTNYDSSDLLGIGHAWSTYAEKENGDDVNVISFDYQFSSNIKPFYKIGSPYPHQVMYLGSNESYNIRRNIYNTLNYSGSDPEHFYNGLYKFRCDAVSGLNTENTADNIEFTINNGIVTEQTLQNTIDNSPVIQTSIIRIFD